MKLKDYLKDKTLYIFIFTFGLLLILSLLILFNPHVLLFMSIIIIYIGTFIFIFAIDYVNKKHFYDNFTSKLNKLDKKYLIRELISNPNFIEASIFIDYLYEINKCYIEDLNNYKISNKEFREYIELWCHEIKTPVATTKMIIDNNKNKETLSILEETNKIDYLIEQILFYARSESVEKDYIINSINLRELINEIIKKNKKMLISKKIKIDINGDAIVESDSKWLNFIINQIIGNSIKYIASNPTINIDIKNNKNNVILTIKDNGIGIKSDEIERVFDKGFTGTNGRTNSSSTGMGLYLVKELCNKLGHNITIDSKEKEYTKIVIVFPKNSYINNLK